MIQGSTSLIAHIGYPTHTFKSPLIYNPYFEQAGVDAVVVPMGCQAPDYPALLPALFRLTNICGALITMPHKVRTLELIDELSPTAQIAGACNAVRRAEDGRLLGDMFDGEGFVRGVQRKGLQLAGRRALVVGCGGVGSAIAASLVAAGVTGIALYDASIDTANALAARLHQHYPAVTIVTGSKDPAGFDLVVNATPLGMQEGDPLPIDVTRLDAGSFVGEVVLKTEHTPLLQAALARGCKVQVGADMLFEQIPAYLEYFGLPVTTPETLRAVARMTY
ncbi:shikimate dehydrogenase family protein [Uliginosibacterium sp. H1]|uniref:shikimate dehydrogenase family protein n=1 Tax=Uliginosibacterium sp. H1 TaxID=3114757 RepID=UPI002E180988|nr:shikimate dehydrogenase [Uliginosibacterium sp. H1]